MNENLRNLSIKHSPSEQFCEYTYSCADETLIITDLYGRGIFTASYDSGSGRANIRLSTNKNLLSTIGDQRILSRLSELVNSEVVIRDSFKAHPPNRSSNLKAIAKRVVESLKTR